MGFGVLLGLKYLSCPASRADVETFPSGPSPFSDIAGMAAEGLGNGGKGILDFGFERAC